MKRKFELGLTLSVFVIFAIASWRSNYEADQQRKEAERRLQIAEAHTYSIMMHMAEDAGGVCSVEVDSRGNIRRANREFIDTFSLGVGDNISRMLPDAMHQSHASSLAGSVASHTSGGSRAYTDVQCEAITRNGKAQVRVRAWTCSGGAMALINVLEG